MAHPVGTPLIKTINTDKRLSNTNCEFITLKILEIYMDFCTQK